MTFERIKLTQIATGILLIIIFILPLYENLITAGASGLRTTYHRFDAHVCPKVSELSQYPNLTKSMQSSIKFYKIDTENEQGMCSNQPYTGLVTEYSAYDNSVLSVFDVINGNPIERRLFTEPNMIIKYSKSKNIFEQRDFYTIEGKHIFTEVYGEVSLTDKPRFYRKCIDENCVLNTSKNWMMAYYLPSKKIITTQDETKSGDNKSLQR